MSRTEPELPSIHTPLAHENAIAAQPTGESIEPEPPHTAAGAKGTQSGDAPTAQPQRPRTVEPTTIPPPDRQPTAATVSASTEPEPRAENSRTHDAHAASDSDRARDRDGARSWPGTPRRDRPALELAPNQSDDRYPTGWEP